MRIFSSARHLSLLPLVFVIGACAYSTKASYQDITFLSPDAHDAKCLVYVNKVKYQVWPPQTVNIKKSEKPMLVVCHAPGNRTVEVEVPPKFESVAIWGSPVGVAWDYASKSLFSYPEVIAIDFSQEMQIPNALPKHHNPDIRQPEDYDLEEFLPGDPRLNRDRYNKPTRLLRRGESDDLWDDSELFEEEDEGMIEEEEALDADSFVETELSDIEGVIESVTEAESEGEAETTMAAPAETSESEPAVAEAPVSETAPLQPAGGSKSVLTPIAGEAEEASMSEETVQDSEADNEPVSLVPGE